MTPSVGECTPAGAAVSLPGPQHNPWDRWGWAMAVIWLGFLFFPLADAWQADVSAAAKVATYAAIACFGACYVLGFASEDRWTLRLLVAMALCMVATVPVLGIDALGMTPYLGAFSALVVPEPYWRWTTPVIAAVPLLSLLGGDGFPGFFFVLVWPIIGGCVLVRVLTVAQTRVQETRASLALTAERERVARDVHDVLGHSLTALSVKAELAARLVDTDPARARSELESIQATARQALAEVRSTVGGLRASNLEAEITAAPRVLADAGVQATVRGEVGDTDPRHRALLAWVLREAVTNVVRHADATRVEIELSHDGIVVTDDGRGLEQPGEQPGEGLGLRGMRERVEATGGQLEIGADAAGTGTRIEVRLP